MTASDEILDRLLAIRERIAELKQVEVELEADYAAIVGVGTTITRENDVVEVVQPRRFNAKIAKEVLSVSPILLALVEERVIIPAKAKELLPAEVYEKCRVESGTPDVRVKARKDD